MKKFLSLITVAFLATASILTSCDDEKESTMVLPPIEQDTDDNKQEPAQEDPTLDLFNSLQTFNDSLTLATADYCNQTRGGGGFWRKMLKIVCADISGARDGAVVGALFGGEGAAIGASVGAALYSWNAGVDAFGYQTAPLSTDLESVSPNQLQVERAYAQTRTDDTYVNNIQTIQLNFPSAYDNAATLTGKTHNAILYLCKGDNEEAAAIEDITGTLSDFQISVIHSHAFVTKMNQAISSGNYMVDDSDATGNYIINLFMSVADDCAGSQQDLHYIINRYISIIETNGSLSEMDKTQVYSALSVAAYSCAYWDSYTSD